MRIRVTIAMLVVIVLSICVWTIGAATAIAALWEATEEEALTTEGSVHKFTLPGGKVVECSKVSGETVTLKFPRSSVEAPTRYSGCTFEGKSALAACGLSQFEVEEKAETKGGETAGRITLGACTIETGSCKIKFPLQRRSGISYVEEDEGEKNALDFTISEHAAVHEVEFEAVECSGVKSGKTAEYTGNTRFRGKQGPVAVGPPPSFSITITPAHFTLLHQLGTEQIQAHSGATSVISQVNTLAAWHPSAFAACLRMYLSGESCEWELEFLGPLAEVEYQFAAGVRDSAGGMDAVRISGER
jgi:hypothetical protein